MREKTLDDVSSDCRELYQKGRDASSRCGYDQAIAFFNQVLFQEPGFVECREALRKEQRARVQNNSGFLRQVFEEAREVPELVEAEIYLHSKPLKAIRLAEHVLNRVPTSILAHKILAHAALKTGMYRTAFLSLDYIRNHGGTESLDTNLELANALAETGEVSKGLAICGRLLKEFPENQCVIRTLGRLSKVAFEEYANSPKSTRYIPTFRKPVLNRFQKNGGFKSALAK